MPPPRHRKYPRQAWSLLRLPRLLIASHCSIRCRFVGLVTCHQGDAGFTKSCADNLEAHLAFPADQSASRVLGHVVRGEEGLAQHWLYSTLSLPALGSGD